MTAKVNHDCIPDTTERKREEFSKALFETLVPAVRQCDEVVRGVFDSQNKVLTELMKLDKILNEWKANENENNAHEIQKEKTQRFEEYSQKLIHVRGKVNQTANKLNIIHNRLNFMRELIRKKSGNKKLDLW